MEFYKQCRSFSSRAKVQVDDPVALGEDWGLPPRVWHEDWSQASGGEGQRAMLAIAISLKPDILLLDEPTSYAHSNIITDCRALDETAILEVEKTLRDRKLAALWITHSDEQEKRVAVRTIHLGPREGGGSIHSRNTSVNLDGDGDNASVLSGDSNAGLRKKRTGMRRTRSREQSNFPKP
jgi:ABC-type iron transport system FetAB ATPase subunit